MATDGPKQLETHLFRRVDERAHEEHSAECAAEVQILDAREHGFGALDELEHLGIEVDRDDAPPERDQWMRDAAAAAAELEDLSVFGDLPVDELRLVGSLEQTVEIDWRAGIPHGSSVR